MQPSTSERPRFRQDLVAEPIEDNGGRFIDVMAPDSGTVRRPAKDDVGYSPASSGLYPDLTVAENLDFRAQGYGMSRQAARDKAASDREVRVKAAGQARQKEAHHQEQAREFDRRAQALREAIDRDAKFHTMVDIIDELDMNNLSRFSLQTLADKEKREVESL